MMKNVTFDPFGDLDRLTAQLGQFRPGPRYMPVDMYRDGDRYVVNADLPGIDPGSIDVDLDGNVLTIRAQRTADTRAGAKWIVQERPAGSFHERAKPRKIAISSGSEPTSISA